MKNRLTPRKALDSNERLELELEDYSWELYERGGLVNLVVDRRTKNRYLVVRDSCGLPYCNCDCYVKEIFDPVGTART